MESYDIRLKRIQFLKTMMEYRREKRPIVYTDETYIHSSHTDPKGWYDDSSRGFKKPISKGQRLIIVHAGGSMGFIESGLLIFKSGIYKKYTYIYIIIMSFNVCCTAECF